MGKKEKEKEQKFSELRPEARKILKEASTPASAKKKLKELGLKAISLRFTKYSRIAVGFFQGKLVGLRVKMVK